MRKSSVAAAAAAVAVLGLYRAAPARAGVAFLPATDAPVLLLLDTDALTPARLDAARVLGYALDPQMPPDCSTTDFELMTARLRTAPYVVAVVAAADRDALLAALRFEAFAIEHDAPLAATAPLPPLLEPVAALLRDTAAPDRYAILARRTR